MKRLILITIAAAAIAVTSCKNPVNNEPYLDQNIALILRSPTDTVGLQIAKGTLSAAAQFGILTEIFTADSLTDYKGQIDIIENLDLENYIGVIIIPASQTELNATINELNTAIPVVVAGAEISATIPILSYVGTDQLAAGQNLAEIVNKQIEKEGIVSIFKVGNHPSIASRIFGFGERIFNLGHPVLSTEMASNEHLWYSVRLMVERDYPQVQAIITGDPQSAVIVCDVLKQIDRSDIHVYTFGITPTVINRVSSAMITGTMVPNTFEIGYQSTKSIVTAYFNGKPERTQYQPSMYIDSTNLASKEATTYLNPI